MQTAEERAVGLLGNRCLSPSLLLFSSLFSSFLASYLFLFTPLSLLCPLECVAPSDRGLSVPGVPRGGCSPSSPGGSYSGSWCFTTGHLLIQRGPQKTWAKWDIRLDIHAEERRWEGGELGQKATQRFLAGVISGGKCDPPPRWPLPTCLPGPLSAGVLAYPAMLPQGLIYATEKPGGASGNLRNGGQCRVVY